MDTWMGLIQKIFDQASFEILITIQIFSWTGSVHLAITESQSYFYIYHCG